MNLRKALYNSTFRHACHTIVCDNVRISTALTNWKKTFREHSVSEPGVSAEYIIAHVIGEKTLYNTDIEICLTKDQVMEIDKLCTKRLDRTPLQYVLGEWDFHDLTFTMRPPVLIPRPETEELAGFCISTIRNCKIGQAPFSLLEIGSGSGALSILLLKRFIQLQAVAVDISPVACDLTRHNAETHGVQSRLTVLEGDFTDTRTQTRLHSYGPFSMVVSNPPYVTTREMEDLEPEIGRFEDPIALHGGSDGFSLIKQILLHAPRLLTNDGHLWLETGSEHPKQVESFVSRQLNGLKYDSTELDFSGKERFCHLRKPKSSSEEDS